MSESQGTSSQPLKYAAAAAQTIRLEVKRAGGRYQTSHQMDGCSDELFIEYDKLRNVRVRVGKDKSVETLTDREKAARYVYGKLLQEVKGWGDPKGANVDDKIARMVVEDGLFVCVTEAEEREPEIRDAKADPRWAKPPEEPRSLRCRLHSEAPPTTRC